MFRFEVPAPMFFGPDSRLEVLPVLQKARFQRLGVVIDSGIASQTVFKDFLNKDLSSAGFEISEVFHSRNDAEPDYDYLDSSVDTFRGKRLDCMFGIGGGSAMDLAKGIAVLLTNSGRGIDYRGLDLVQRPGVPLILFPTTAGTGSEITKTASFVDLRTKKKLGINGRYVAAWAGVLDPMLTRDCPPGPTMSAGMDALVHCVESFTAVTSSPMAREIAKSAFPHIFNNLWRVLEDPHNMEGREKILLGSHLAGMAMWNAAGGGPASGISYPVGIFHGIPHGYAGGVLLPYLIRYNVDKGYRGYDPLYDLIEDCDPKPSQGRSLAFADAFAAMYERIEAPRNFGRWGVTTNAVPRLVEDTLRNRAPNLAHNPVPFGRAEVESLIQRVAVPDVARVTR